MTCIAAYVHRGKIVMGADSAGTSGWDMTIRADEKVFVNGPFIMGFTSSFRMGQLLRYSLNVPEQKAGEDNFAFMVTVFVESVRECLKQGGYSKVESNREEGGSFLVGYRGRIYHIHDDFQVGQSEKPFDACGCGESYAKAAMFTFDRLVDKHTIDFDPEYPVRHALQTAEGFSAGVRGPFRIVQQP